ncbi:hypothetical protein [Geminicoccus harenae]|uniref:hypothetical protein n=1 Tax=Geminicoccus harenae TaxID=2498453 RepID=UPI00168A7CE3|nr:hypothetical protein [Geminicoccus harenae]
MFNRSSALAILGAAAAMSSRVLSGMHSLVEPVDRAPRDRRPALASGPSHMMYGITKRGSGTVAQAKRAALKSRNRARNKAAHRG